MLAIRLDMSINWSAFLVVLVVAYVIPGPDFAVILRQATQTRRSGVLAAVGAQAGLCVHMLLAVVGLSAVLARRPEMLTLIRVAGGLYLVWLGASLAWRARNASGPRRQQDASDDTGRGAFMQGFLTNVTNPKAILFFASVLPQFISPDGSIAGQVLLLGVVDVLFGFLPWALVVWLGDRLGRRLASVRFRLWRDRVTGTGLASVGATVLATTRWARP
ncbi:MAG: LysE family translocator [Nocardioides sp.]